MIAPFFPGEASKKGTNTTIVGLIFAVFPLVVILTSPVVGIVIPIIGPKSTLILGLILEAGAQIIFGFLDLMPNKLSFIIFCFLVRIVCGLGAATTSTSCFTLLTMTFKENLSPAMGIMETFGGFGMMAGPPIGGFLYSIGGFKLPFLAVGSLALVAMLPLYFILPNDTSENLSNKSGGKVLFQAVTTPSIAVIAITIAVGGMTLSFLDPTLQHHLQKPFHLSPTKVGLMFLIGPGVYTIVAPLCGMIADKSDSRIMIVIGSFIVGISYVLLGPTPCLPSTVFPSSLWLNGIALAILGIGVGPLCVPALADMNLSAKRYGLPEGILIQSALSSIFNSMFNVGAIAGPTLGSILVQHLGFPWASGIFGFVLFFVGFFLIIFTFLERKSKRYRTSLESNFGVAGGHSVLESDTEKKPLLG